MFYPPFFKNDLKFGEHRQISVLVPGQCGRSWVAENMASGIFADLADHLKPDRGMEESIIMARCVGIGEWTRTVKGTQWRNQLSICMVAVGGRRRRTLECSVPAVTPLASRGRLANWGVNSATCQELILLQVSGCSQRILLLSVCELILCRHRPRQTLHKMASVLLCEVLLACLPSKEQ